MPHSPDVLDRALGWLTPVDYAAKNRVVDIETGHIDVCGICHAPLNDPSDFLQFTDQDADIICLSSHLVKCADCGHCIHDECELLYQDGLQSRKPCPYCKAQQYFDHSTIVRDQSLNDLIAFVHATLDVVIIDLMITTVIEDALAEVRTPTALEQITTSLINDVVADMTASICADPSLQAVKIRTDEYKTWLARRALTTKRHRTKNGCTGWKRRSAKFKGIKFAPCISP